jgi:hypothetical protein
VEQISTALTMIGLDVGDDEGGGRGVVGHRRALAGGTTLISTADTGRRR